MCQDLFSGAPNNEIAVGLPLFGSVPASAHPSRNHSLPGDLHADALQTAARIIASPPMLTSHVSPRPS